MFLKGPGLIQAYYPEESGDEYVFKFHVQYTIIEPSVRQIIVNYSKFRNLTLKIIFNIHIHDPFRCECF